MAVKLIDGDYATDNRGRILQAIDSDEIIERALIRLRVKKGSFSFNRNLGSELHLLDLNSVDKNQLMSIVCDALSPIPQVEVVEVKRLINQSADTLSLNIDLIVNNEKTTVSLNQ